MGEGMVIRVLEDEAVRAEPTISWLPPHCFNGGKMKVVWPPPPDR